MNRKINTIDLFAGCGGLLDGFLQEGGYTSLACVEWEKAPCETLANRLKTKWNHKNAETEVIRFDIQRTDELFSGFDDEIYGKHKGLDKLIGEKTVDAIIGGPPCQAYSLAGRIRDANGMRDDYRNYLFESYLKVVNHFKPKFFIFENVVGMLSAAPDGTLIVDKIRKAFTKAGYQVTENFRNALYDVADFGIPQHRNRVIILGVRKDAFDSESTVCKILNDFYNILMPGYKGKSRTVRDAIGDLPPIYPSKTIIRMNGRKYSHTPISSDTFMNHNPRFHSERDQKVFSLLAEDIETGRNAYTNINVLKELYTTITGKKSNIHKFYVLRWDE